MLWRSVGGDADGPLFDVRTARRNFIVADDRLRPLGNGVDLRRLAPERFGADDRASIRSSLGLRDHECVVGFGGRLVRPVVATRVRGCREIALPEPQACSTLSHGAATASSSA